MSRWLRGEWQVPIAVLSYFTSSWKVVKTYVEMIVPAKFLAVNKPKYRRAKPMTMALHWNQNNGDGRAPRHHHNDGRRKEPYKSAHNKRRSNKNGRLQHKQWKKRRHQLQLEKNLSQIKQDLVQHQSCWRQRSCNCNKGCWWTAKAGATETVFQDNNQ